MAERILEFMLWDGVALCAYAAIIMLAIWRTHARLGLLIAICIPLASIVMFVLNLAGVQSPQPFLQAWVVVFMFFVAGLVMIPWFESPV